ncbi:MAG TPA: SDR family oxidoreductase [Verrucomicrobiae bacterium]|nr:SDR family oxidoreductase [Verrucomicrobiae bacterium]
MRLKGKRAFISGAGGGIGEAAALKFAAEGARVILADIRSPAAEAVAARIAAVGGEAVAVAGDIADPEQCRRMIDEGAQQLGGLDLMFNNAGIVLGEDTGPVETPLAVWEQTIRVNLTGVFLACKFGIPHLLRAGGGSVVNNASVVALVGSAYPQIAYTAAKGGVVAMTREMAVLYGRKGLRFNAVCPGPVGTSLVRAFIKEESNWESRRPYMPMGRLGTVEEVANLVAFLVSDEASYITGAAYAADGGISAAYVIRDE